MIRVGVFGAAGRMGSTVCAAVVADPALELVAAVDPQHAGLDLRVAAKVDSDLHVAPGAEALLEARAEVVVDFSVLAASRENLAFAAEHGIHAVVGTTGFTEADLDGFRDSFTRSSCFIAPNFAIGAVLMMRFAELAAPWFETAEVIELHHDQKIDAPSGTAMLTVERMAAASSSRAPAGPRGRPASRCTRFGYAGCTPTKRCCSGPPGSRCPSATTPTTAPATCRASSSQSSESPNAPASRWASTPCWTCSRDAQGQGRKDAAAGCLQRAVRSGWGHSHQRLWAREHACRA
jgi:4-hydroxy-tetrahydrodipicolinate reductase